MKTFIEFLSEGKKEIRWNTFPDIGWWEDQDPLRMYHGTNKANFKNVLRNGLTKFDPDTNMISLAFEPNTGHGYASMYGGEANFRKSGKKAQHVPDEDRIVFVFDIPMKWIKENMDTNFSGNFDIQKKRLRNKEEYEKFNGKDVSYYSVAEIRVKKKVPAKFIAGYMRKKK